MAPVHGRIGFLLVVEPEALLRWSLATYFSKWFDVFPTETQDGADRVLDDQIIDAVVISDQLSAEAAEEIASRTRALNEAARIVRTVTRVDRDDVQAHGSYVIEKPFEFTELATFLGVDADC